MSVPTLPHLRALIGLKVRYAHREWVVIEVVDRPLSLVLQANTPASIIQTDMHGRPREYAVETRMLPVLAPDQTGPSDELLTLEIVAPTASHQT